MLQLLAWILIFCPGIHSVDICFSFKKETSGAHRARQDPPGGFQRWSQAADAAQASVRRAEFLSASCHALGPQIRGRCHFDSLSPLCEVLPTRFSRTGFGSGARILPCRSSWRARWNRFRSWTWQLCYWAREGQQTVHMSDVFQKDFKSANVQSKVKPSAHPIKEAQVRWTSWNALRSPEHLSFCYTCHIWIYHWIQVNLEIYDDG